LQSGKIQDCNTFANPEKVKPAVFSAAKPEGDEISLVLPAFSVVVLEIK
jgi:alpha-N-arabinofuranosidase